MTRALALLVALLGTACAGAAAAPTPPVPAEIVFLAGGGGMRLFEVRGGTLLAQLPEGAFDASLTAGGDLGEAYVVGAGGVQQVRAGRPVRVERVADSSGAAPFAAALVPAPGLTSFVGAKTVLVVLSADGRLTGYQAGTRLWSSSVPGAGELRRLGEVAVLRTAGGWFRVAPETGALDALRACPAGPLGGSPAHLVFACDLVPAPPAGPAYDLRPPAADEVLAWPSGEFYRVHHGTAANGGRGRGGGRPAISADGRTLFWPAAFVGASAAAMSRDGSVVYLAGDGRLRVWAPGLNREVSSFAAEGTDIPLVAGG